MEYKVRHNQAESRFEVIIDNLESVIEYTINTNGNMEITHTGVPSELEGKGIAASLTKSLLNYARDNSYKVIPVCSYVAVYIERHPEYQDLVVK